VLGLDPDSRPRPARDRVDHELAISKSHAHSGPKWYRGVVPRDLRVQTATPPGTTKAPQTRGFLVKRMKGLEPSTFCMANSRYTVKTSVYARSGSR